jgi:hypothetical protein
MESRQMHLVTNTLLLGIAVIPTLCGAQIKPGLWETTGKVQGGKHPLAQIQKDNANATPEQRQAMQSMPQLSSDMLAKMKEQIAKLPPDQRKSMEASMEAMKNLSVNKDGNAAMNVCITKEMIDGQQFLNPDGRCSYVKGAITGGTQKFNFTCTDPASSGEGTVSFQSNTNYTGLLKIKSVQNGRTEELVIESTGKFLEANCGSVKPLPNAR